MKLYYDHPAENWHESLPLGNGRIGAMVYGGTKKEILALNEDTLWSGYPEKTQKKLPEGYLEKVRELTEKREYQKAMEYLEECFSSSEDVQMYVSFWKCIYGNAGRDRRNFGLSPGTVPGYSRSEDNL